MKRLAVVMMVVFTLLFCIGVYAERVIEVPTLFQGQYLCYKDSRDGGQTWKNVPKGMYFIVTSTRLITSLADGSQFNGSATYVNMEVESDGTSSMGFRIDTFPDGVYWIFRLNPQDNRIFCVQHMRVADGKLTEYLRTYGWVQR